MAEISNLAPTTELEAVNAMLAAIGEAPVDDLAGATQPDVEMAISLLRGAAREVQSVGWRFNTEFGLEITPLDTFDWLDTSGSTTTLNIFVPPAGLAAFRVNKTWKQADLDVVIRRSKKYEDAGQKVLVFYDRKLNRDGLDASKYPSLYIDAVWFFDFEDLPETARRYITVLAARRFIESVVGSTTLAGFTDDDLLIALRNLKREQGEEDDYNMLNSASTFHMLGRRARSPMRVFEDRDGPTGA